MADDSALAVDLLGDPWSELKDPRGRKRHKRNVQVAETVAVLRATGKSVEEIASRIGLAEATLRKYYSRELEQGPALALAVVDEAMFRKAKAGNASAARYIKERFAEGGAAVPAPKARPRAAAEPRPAPLGKKAAADQAAQTAHEQTGWGELLTPPDGKPN